MLVLNPSPGAICFLGQSVIIPPMFDPVYVSFTLLLNHSLKRFSGLFSLLRINFSSLAFVVSVGVCTAIVFSEATSCIPAIATVGAVVLRISLRLCGVGCVGGLVGRMTGTLCAGCRRACGASSSLGSVGGGVGCVASALGSVCCVAGVLGSVGGSVGCVAGSLGAVGCVDGEGS